MIVYFAVSFKSGAAAEFEHQMCAQGCVFSHFCSCCRDSQSTKYFSKRMPKLNSMGKAFFKDFSSLTIFWSSNIQEKKNPEALQVVPECHECSN